MTTHPSAVIDTLKTFVEGLPSGHGDRPGALRALAIIEQMSPPVSDAQHPLLIEHYLTVRELHRMLVNFPFSGATMSSSVNTKLPALPVPASWNDYDHLTAEGIEAVETWTQQALEVVCRQITALRESVAEFVTKASNEQQELARLKSDLAGFGRILDYSRDTAWGGEHPLTTARDTRTPMEVKQQQEDEAVLALMRVSSVSRPEALDLVRKLGVQA